MAVVDQAVSAFSNLLITLAAARALGVEEFGHFGVAFLLAAFSIGASRALIGSPALVRQAAARRRNGADPMAAVFSFALVVAGLCVLAALIVGDDRASLIVLAVVIPGILVQDLGRNLAFAELQPARALHYDLIWLVVEALGIVVLLAVRASSAHEYVLVWGISATVAAIPVLWRHGRQVRLPSVLWVKESWDFAWRYSVAFVATLGAYQVTGVLLGVVSGVAAVGSVRAAQVLFGPVNNLTSGMLVALVPEQGMSVPSVAVRRRLAVASMAISLVAGFITVIALMLPDSVGEGLLGDSWESARGLLIPAGISAGLLGSIIGAMVGLRAAQAVRESLRIELRLAVMVGIGPMAGAFLADASGYMWALVATLAVGSVMWWLGYSDVIREYERTGVSPSERAGSVQQ